MTPSGIIRMTERTAQAAHVGPLPHKYVDTVGDGAYDVPRKKHAVYSVC